MIIMPRRQSKARPKPKKMQSQIDKLVEELVKKKEDNGGESEQEKQEKTI